MSERLNGLLWLANNKPTIKEAVIPERQLSGHNQWLDWPSKSHSSHPGSLLVLRLRV